MATISQALMGNRNAAGKHIMKAGMSAKTAGKAMANSLIGKANKSGLSNTLVSGAVKGAVELLVS